LQLPISDREARKVFEQAVQLILSNYGGRDVNERELYLGALSGLVEVLNEREHRTRAPEAVETKAVTFAGKLSARNVELFLEAVKGKKITIAIIAALSIWYAGSFVITYPNQLSYFNEFVGGSDNGYKYMDDSNIDWGHDLKRLKEFVDNNPETKVMYIWRQGDTALEYYGIGKDRSLLNTKNWWKDPSGTYAIRLAKRIRQDVKLIPTCISMIDPVADDWIWGETPECCLGGPHSEPRVGEVCATDYIIFNPKDPGYNHDDPEDGCVTCDDGSYYQHMGDFFYTERERKNLQIFSIPQGTVMTSFCSGENRFSPQYAGEEDNEDYHWAGEIDEDYLHWGFYKQKWYYEDGWTHSDNCTL